MSDFVPYVGPAAGAGPDTRQSLFETNPVARDRLPDGELEFTFEDFLDLINPLQHIPVVSWIYRAITGDEIGTAPRLIGGALFGGPAGLLLAGAQAMVEHVTGTEKEGGPVVAVARALFGGSEDGKDTASASAADAANGAGGANLASAVSGSGETSPASPAGQATATGASAAAQMAPVELRVDVSPAAGAAGAVTPAANIGQAAPFVPRPPPVAMPHGWGSLGNPRFERAAAASALSPAAFADDTPAARAAPAPAQTAAAAAETDWVANAMMRALDKYENARRLNAGGAPKVSTVQ